MTGLKNKLYTIETIVLFALCCACHSSPKNQSGEISGYLNSSTYREYLTKYQNKSEILSSDKRFFNLIGEDAFLYNSDYDMYAIYLYQGYGNSDLYLYILKGKDSIFTATRKSFKTSDYLFYAKNTDENYHRQFNMEVFSKIVSSPSTQTFTDIISKCTPYVEKRIPKDFERPISVLFYFDGSKYFRLSEFQIEGSMMFTIDSLFRSSPLFDQ